MVTYLGKVLPYAVMGMLVVYCMKDVRFTELSELLPTVLASVTVVVLHAWKRNTLLSILAGTVLYMVLVQAVFSQRARCKMRPLRRYFPGKPTGTTKSILGGR